MSTKNKKRQKPSPERNIGVDQGFQKKKTAIAVIIAGGFLALWFAFVPESWWKPGNIEISAAKHSMIGLVAASLTLSTLMLTSSSSENIYKTSLYLTTGVVAWMAAFFAVEVKSLEVAFWMLLCLFPLAIAISAPYIPKPTQNNIPLLLLFIGVAMVVIPLVLSSTKAGLIMLNILIIVFGEFLDKDLVAEILYAFLVLTGIFGVLLILVVLGYGWAKSLGDAQSKILMPWTQDKRKRR